uniref:F-box domain-containing protein n=1 Tax=Panagrolaimus sp. PS1159 TaxID=55785 RepID=A0AC35G5G0_9BILA
MSDEKDSIMLLPASFFDKLDPKYREKLAELEKTLKREKSRKIAIDSLMDFLNQFMMPKEFWNKLFKLISDEPPVMRTPLKIISSLSHYQYFYDDYLGYVTNLKIKIYDHEYHGRVIDVEELCYPQKYLETKFVQYEKTYASSFIPISVIRTYKRMKRLYTKIKSVEKNVEEWFKALKEAEDEEFVEHNVEYRIGSDLTNKKLWKMYIEYLKENNQEKLLQTYSKYCRFFLNDIKMIEEYRKAVGDKKSLSFACDSFLPKRFEKLFISTNLTLTPQMFPHFISRIYRCTAKYISLIFLKLSNEEMDILIGHGNVEDLYFYDIKDSNDELFKLENVLKMVPKIKRLRISFVCCTSKTSEILCELPFKNKINSFSVNYIKDTLLEPNAFAIFMQKNISPNSEILLHFDQKNPNYIRNFKETVNVFIEENWKEKEDKPYFSVA